MLDPGRLVRGGRLSSLRTFSKNPSSGAKKKEPEWFLELLPVLLIPFELEFLSTVRRLYLLLLLFYNLHY